MLPADLRARLEATGLPTDLEGMLEAIARQRPECEFHLDRLPDLDGRWTWFFCLDGTDPMYMGRSPAEALARWLLAAKEAHHADC